MDTEIETLRRLMDVGRQLLSELDPEVVLERILDEARAATGARYAALGVLNDDRTELARLLTAGMGHDVQRAIADLPKGLGVLGVLISEPIPLRLLHVGEHPKSFGFPVGHPPMDSFLGVPILIRGRAWGNLYLAEKDHGDGFGPADERAAVVLAQFAATAIENAQLYQTAERGRQQLAQAVRGLEAARAIADAISADWDLERILELIVKRGRALVDARTVLIMLREGSDLVVAASAGDGHGAPGHRLPVVGSTSGDVLGGGRPLRVADVDTGLRIPSANLGVTGASTALLVPMLHRGVGIGVLAAFDRDVPGAQFTAADEELLKTFAASAANAVALSRSVEAGRLRTTITAAEGERRRWSRELHDQTLQALGRLRVLLSTASRESGVGELLGAINHAVGDVDEEIENLRAIIADLRPSLLDDLGLEEALEALIDQRRADGLEIATEIALPPSDGISMAPELETTVYRLVQESLTNVVKHAQATTVDVRVTHVGDSVTIEVRDDGVGFDASADTVGFGLVGFRERVYLVGGSVRLQSGESGTTLAAEIPVGAGAVLGSARDE